MEIRGCDLSEFNDNIHIKELADNGLKFAILRGAGTFRKQHSNRYLDRSFESFYKEAKDLNFPVGAYYYSTADTYDQGKAEANYFYENCLKGKKFEYPVFIDVEEDTCQTEGALGFMDTLEDKGYFVGIYANLNYFSNILDEKKLSRYCHWLAYWSNKKPDVGFNYGIWQNTSALYVNGKRVDGNICYVDYMTRIINDGFNGYEKAEDMVIKKGDTLIVTDIKNGKITFKKGA